MYINKHILNCLVRNKNTKKKLQYIYNLEIPEKDIVNLEKLILQKKDGIDEEVIDIESNHEKDNDEKDDNIEILGACF